jgi:hypothetical protein
MSGYSPIIIATPVGEGSMEGRVARPQVLPCQRRQCSALLLIKL